MAYDLGAITGKLTLDSGGFTRAMLNAQTLTSAFGQTFTGFVTNPVVAGIGAFKDLAGAAVSGAVAIAAEAEKLDRLSRQTGVTTQTIQTLGRVLEEQGQSAEGAGAAVLAFTRKLGDARKDGGATADTLKQLGIDIASVGTGEGALLKIFDQLVAIKDEGVRAAAAAELFDRQFGSALATAVSGGSAEVARLRDEFIKAGVVMDESGIKKALELDARMDSLGRTFTGVKNSLILEFLGGVSTNAQQTDAQITELAQTLKTKLGPAAHDLGEVMVFLTLALADLLKVVREVLSYLHTNDAAVKALELKRDLIQDERPTTPSGIRRRAQRLRDAQNAYESMAFPNLSR